MWTWCCSNWFRWILKSGIKIAHKLASIPIPRYFSMLNINRINGDEEKRMPFDSLSIALQLEFYWDYRARYIDIVHAHYRLVQFNFHREHPVECISDMHARHTHELNSIYKHQKEHFSDYILILSNCCAPLSFTKYITKPFTAVRASVLFCVMTSGDLLGAIGTAMHCSTLLLLRTFASYFDHHPNDITPFKNIQTKT